MFKCPYCHAKMAHPTPEQIPLSARRREVFEYVAKGGREGVKSALILKELFQGRSEVSLRTTIHGINGKILPSKIIVKAGTVRLIEA